MQIAVADAGCGGAHEDLVLLRIVDVDLFDCQRLIGGMKYGGLHCVAPIPVMSLRFPTMKITSSRMLLSGARWQTNCARFVRPLFTPLMVKIPASDCRFIRFMIFVAPARKEARPCRLSRTHYLHLS